MLKILQARLPQYTNHGLPDVQAGFRKGRGTRDQLPTSVGTSKKQENYRKTSTSVSLITLKPLTVWIIINYGKLSKRWEYQAILSVLPGEMAEWHHWCNGHELEQTLGDDEGQGGLACCSPWGHKDSDMTKWLNNYNIVRLTLNSQWDYIYAYITYLDSFLTSQNELFFFLHR